MSKHVVFVAPINEFYSPISGGAVTTIIVQNARELLQRGHRVSVLASLNADEAYNVGTVIPIRSPRRDELNFPQRVFSRLRGKIKNFGWPYYDYYLASILRGLKKLSSPPDAIMFFNDPIAPSYVRRKFPKTRLLLNLQNEVRSSRSDVKLLFSKIDKILACSHHIQDWTGREYGLPAEQLAVLNSGVDLEAFFPSGDYLQPQKELRVLFVGRIDRNKGPDIAADAVAVLQKEKLSISLTVAGGLWFYGHGKENEDPYFVSLKEKMKNASAHYLGHVTRKEIPEVFRNHDVVCVLSRSTEPFGLVVLEAMASGCAVVASNRGGLPDACGPAGVQLDPDDFPTVTQALRNFCQNSAALSDSKLKSRNHALNCSWSSRVDELEKYL